MSSSKTKSPVRADQSATPQQQGRRPDASMDLLNQIMRQPLDPDYARVAAQGAPPPRLRWPLAIIAVVIGAMFAVSALQTTRSAPVIAGERQELISRIRNAETEQDTLRAKVTALSNDITRLRGSALGNDSASRELEGRINVLEPSVGSVAVTGPGLAIVVDDGPDQGNDRARVADTDLQILVNGLWIAGAEAVAINGHRISNLTAIRGAGDAITVDYRSLTRPYRIEAIGDPKTLQADYVESSGGAWWNLLEQNYQMRHEITDVKELTLPADPGMVLRYARKAGS
ncbi:DUF881 domain-containing protein [Microlunatus panaciterrae]|uniref:Uncharacterized protein YlxW (UPF0749 family) n=1 Tax=Microlunatus panaciterrae TaxID=400768 RepID=A0ABS2RGQ4_9ACTN|nr:DUF881 domain-containing protein [Microlunatus panaciterrae]MBM7797104.1 uncharacterized protein YlxW (UPF0749 family) [Microlunatus panaciterrae]